MERLSDNEIQKQVSIINTKYEKFPVAYRNRIFSGVLELPLPHQRQIHAALPMKIRSIFERAGRARYGR